MSPVKEEQMKTCSDCGYAKDLRDFHNNKNTLDGKRTKCRVCYNAVRKASVRLDPRTAMLNRAKTRAKAKGLKVDITVEDIDIPKMCPIFDQLMEVGAGKLSPSLDRIDSTKGYIKGNVWVISHRANQIKNDSTLDELKQLTEALDLCQI
jgi:hypothetical protein